MPRIMQITDQDRELVNQSVAAAESESGVEIVPVIAVSAGRYDRPEDICGLWMGIASLLVVWTFLPNQGNAASGWGSFLAAAAPVFLVASIILGFIAGVWFACLFPTLRRLAIPRSELAEEVDRCAQAAFFDNRVHHAPGSRGVLVFISLFERRAVVLADEDVLNAVGQPQIQQWCEALTGRLRQSDVIPALCGTIVEIGGTLSSHFPGEANQANVLPDALVVLPGP